MKHFVAYGNSDQASFRDDDVRQAFDFLTVPGTIAAYYPDATAGFVLSSELDYMIDLRTPLFQGSMQNPRASHYVLADWLGPAVRSHMGEPDGSPVLFDHTLYSESVIQDLVNGVLSAQRTYGSRSTAISDRLDRYRRLLAEARGELTATQTPESRPPSFVLAPYFAMASTQDPWWPVSERIWRRCIEVGQGPVCPVVAVADARVLAAALAAIPDGMSDTAFYWITGFDERRATDGELIEVANAIRGTPDRSLVNLYGGFFSVLLAYVGLWGFSNGLGYSETRSWPELSTTGAAPARYYVPQLHLFMAPAAAQLLVETDPWFMCPCPVCAMGGVAALQYRDLKRHFAWSRRSEVELVSSTQPETLATLLEEAATRIDVDVRPNIPARLIPDVRFLRTWARVVRHVTQ
jgi:hypothetical protein